VTDRPVDPTAAAALADERGIRHRSVEAGEPSWLLARRLDALARFERFNPTESGLGGVAAATPRSASAPAPVGTAVGAESGVVGFPPELVDLGVIVEPLDVAVRRHPELVQPHLGTVTSAVAEEGIENRDGDEDLNEALNGAMWSGGTFIHVPPGVVLTIPIQATSRGRAAAIGRFDRTLLVAGEGSAVHYIEGCSAPIYAADPLRSSVTEIAVGAGARVTHTAIQNWSTNVVNLVVKRATVEADGHLEWIDGNMGSRRTSTRPTARLVAPGASATVRSVTMAEAGQRQDVGARMIHDAPATRSSVEARVIVDQGGVCTHRGQVEMGAAASGAASVFAVDALVLDDRSRVEPSLDRQVEPDDVTIEERNASAPLDDDQLHYLASRGLPRAQAEALLANGFIAAVTGRLPVEFAVEWNRLIELQRAGSVG